MISRCFSLLVNHLTTTRLALLLAHLFLLYYLLKGNSNLTMSSQKFVELNNGQKMPAVGLGTWQVTDEAELENALEESLKLGYVHIDTAYLYTNEAIIGRVLERWLSSGKIQRNDLFITSKLPGIGMTPERVEYFLKKSLADLKLDYVDLYLVHSPMGYQYISDTELTPMKDGQLLLDNETDLEAIWKALEAQVDAGLTKSIGVSNYNIAQLERIVKMARIPPANIQVELHAYFQQKPLQEACKRLNVKLCAYAPLGSPGRKALFEKRGIKFEELGLLQDPVVNEIATKHNKTASQILLRFLVQQDIIVIPKSTNPNRLRQNLEIFDFQLSTEDMSALQKLDKGLEGRSFTAKAFKGVTDHPEYPFNSY